MVVHLLIKSDELPEHVVKDLKFLKPMTATHAGVTVIGDKDIIERFVGVERIKEWSEWEA